MTLQTVINKPCTLVQRSADTVDQYGDQTKTTTSTPSVCEVQPLTDREVEGGNMGIGTFRLYLSGDAALNADDAVIIDAETYELTGDAQAWRNPLSGSVEYTEALVRRVRDA